MKTCYLISFLFFASFIGAGGCYGQENSNIADSITITGTVVDSNHEPLFNAKLTLIRGDTLAAETVTNLEGNFLLKVPHGTPLLLNVAHIAHKKYEKRNITDNIKNLPVILYPEVIEYEFRSITVPFFDKFDGGHTKTIRSEEIEQSAH